MRAEPRLARRLVRVFPSLLAFAVLLTGTEALLRRRFPSLRYFEHRPGVTGGIAYSTNRWGMREREFPLEKPPGELRVLALGDSTTFGYGEAYDSTWPKVVQRRLIARGYDAFVINGAGMGRHTHLQLRLFTESYHRFGADVVVVGLCLNDVVVRTAKLDEEQLLHQANASSLLTLLRASRELRHHLSRLRLFALAQYLSSRYVPVYDAQAMIEHFPHVFNAFGATPYAERAWRDTLASLSALIDAVEATGAVPVLVPIPYRFMLSDDERDNQRHFDRARLPVRPVERLAAFAAERGVPFVDSLGALTAARRRMLRGEDAYDPLYVELDFVHPNATGYRLIGEAVADTVATVVARPPARAS